MGSASGFLIIDDNTDELYSKSNLDLHETICQILLPRLIQSRNLSAIHVILQSGRENYPIRNFSQTMDQVSLWQLEHRDCIREALEIARSTQCETLVMIRPENPLTAPEEVDRLIEHHRVHRCAYSSNQEPRGQNGYPRGLGAEAISLAHLELLKREEPDLRCWSEMSTRMQRQRKDDLLRSLPSRTGPEVDLSLSGRSKGLDLLIDELWRVSKDPSWSPEEILRTYRNVNQVKTLVLLEHGGDILHAVEWGKTSGGKVHYIALDPCGSYELERQGIPFTTKADYMTGGEFNRIGMDNFTFLYDLCDAIDGDLRHRFPEIPVRPAISVFYELKIIFDAVLVAAATLKGILAAEKPDAIRIYARPPFTQNPDERPFRADDSIYALLVSLTSSLPVSMIEAGEHRVSPPPYRNLWHRIRDSLHSLTASNSLLFNMGILGKRKGILSIHLPVTSRFRNPHGATVLIYGSGYNWDDSLEDLYRAGIRRILRICDPNMRESLKNRDEIGEIVSRIGKDYMVNKGFPIPMDRRVSHYLLRKTVSLVLRSLEECLFAHHQATAVIRSQGVRALLVSTLPTPAGNAFVQAAREFGIPVISWQHGGAGYAYHPMMIHIEMAGSTLHLVFGEGAGRSYLKTCEQYRRFSCPGISAVGSSSLDALPWKRDQNRGRGKVVYVTTLYLGNLFQVSMLLARGEFDGELWSFQKSVIDLAARHPGCEFVIKLHPAHRSRQPLLAYIADRGINTIRIIVDEQSIMNLVKDADAVLFDLISTGILQVLTTEKQIFVYSGLIGTDSHVEELLARRAHVSRDPLECIASLERYLSGNDIRDGTDCRNTEFLREFGTHRNDGLSGQRAADLVVTLLRQHEQG